MTDRKNKDTAAERSGRLLETLLKEQPKLKELFTHADSPDEAIESLKVLPFTKSGKPDEKHLKNWTGRKLLRSGYLTMPITTAVSLKTLI